MHAIEVDGLTKKFNGFTAVDNIDFTVDAGELFGLLGPNGAGKTTTINILSTLLDATAGHGRIFGFDVARDKHEVRKKIGVVFQEVALDVKLTGKENLDFHGMMYGMAREERREKVKEVLELVELTDKADALVETYSGGMKRRLEIARGLVHKPNVLFLDEPTLGLDAQTRRHIWDYIKKLNKESDVTIILTSHYMEEADYLCERIAIMDNGKFVAAGSPEKLKDVLGGDVVSLELEGGTGNLIAHLNDKDWIKILAEHDGVLSLTLERGERRIPELVTAAQAHDVKVSCVHLRKPSLEDVFLHYTGKTIRDREASQSERNRAMMRGRMGKRR